MPARVGLTRSVVIFTVCTVHTRHTYADITIESGVRGGTGALMLTRLEKIAGNSRDVAGLTNVGGVGTRGSKERKR